MKSRRTEPGPGARFEALLQRSSPTEVTLYAVAIAFTVYFCMYAFRKPFSATTYEGLTVFGTTIKLKYALVVSQLVGYTLSKFIGIRLTSEVSRDRQLRWLIGLILFAEAALLLFALVPAPLKVVAIFANGLPLGMVWGLVVRYLEGRRASEVMLAGLSCSYILASGVVKDVGRGFIATYEVDPFWMPFVTGLYFLPLFVLSVWLLDRLPPPDALDEQERGERRPMGSDERWAFLGRYLPGLVLLITTYFVLTAYRDFRDNFGIDLFKALGVADTTDNIFTKTETPIAFVVMGVMATLSLVRDNRRGLVATYGIMVAGLALMGGGTLLWQNGAVEGTMWMVLVGLGAYLIYVPFGSVLFDRMFASAQSAGTAVFAIYVADATGYLGSVSVTLAKDLLVPDMPVLEFFVSLTWLMSIGGIVLMVSSGVYFFTLRSQERAPYSKLAVVGAIAISLALAMGAIVWVPRVL